MERAGQSEFKYFAFISYSRKDSWAAAFLHRKLEKFRIPVRRVPVAFRHGLGKFVRPVFRDTRDLEVSEDSFTGDIKQALRDSRFIIVLCSPNSAQSSWVSEEVAYFLSTHEKDLNRVIPIILSGKPGSCDLNTECLCESLRSDEVVPIIVKRNLPTMIPDEGEPEKVGWEAGVVGVLSYMLKIKRIYVKAAIDAERIRYLRINTIVGVFFMSVFAALAIWAVKSERLATQNRLLAEANEKRAVASEQLAKRNEARAVAGELSANKQRDRAMAAEKLSQENRRIAEENEKRAMREEQIAIEQRNRALVAEAQARTNELLAIEQKEIAQNREKIATASISYLEQLFKKLEYGRSKGIADVVVEAAGEIEKEIESDEVLKKLAFPMATLLVSMERSTESRRFIIRMIERFAKDKEDIESKGVLSRLYRLQSRCVGATKEKEALLIKALECVSEIPCEDLCEANFELGSFYADEKHYEKAEGFMLKALMVSDYAKYRKRSILNSLSRLYVNMGKLEEGMECIRKGLAQVHKGDKEWMVYNELGFAFSLAKKYDEAVKYYQKALVALEADPDHSKVDRFFILDSLHFIYSDCKKFSLALEICRKAIAIQEEIVRDQLEEVRKAKENQNRLDVKFQQTWLESKQNSLYSLKKQELYLLVALGDRNGIEITSKEIKDKCRMVLADPNTNRSKYINALDDLAYICLLCKEYKSATEYYSQLCDNYIKEKDYRNAGLTFNTLSDIYIDNLNDPNKAYETLTKAETYLTQWTGENSILVMGVKIKIAMINFSRKDIDKVKKKIDEATAIYDSRSNIKPSREVICLFLLRAILSSDSDKKQSLVFLRKAKEIYGKCPVVGIDPKTIEDMIKNLEKEGMK